MKVGSAKRKVFDFTHAYEIVVIQNLKFTVKNCFLFLLFSQSVQHAAAQSPTNVVQPIPRGYLTFPIMPGKQNFLVGNMGELRPNHFHSGLDIRTMSREGLPVYACADGYVSRVRASTAGYGNVLYVTHPNGLVTVYAHLRTFNRAIGDYVRHHQYEKQTFEIELTPKPFELAVLKGEVIAASGNTGSSGGPHLHFEVRDTKDNILNPQYYGFDEIVDKVPPAFEKIGLRTLEVNSRVNNQFGLVEFTPKKVNAQTYTIAQPIPASGKIGLELLVYDKSTGLENKNGVTCVEVKVNGQESYYHHLETFAFDQLRHINVHVDYPVERTEGTRFQRCYVADGNELPIYRTGASKGKMTIANGSTNQVTVTLWDSYRNKSQLNFTIKWEEPTFRLPALKPTKLPSKIDYAIDENTLVVNVKNVKTLSNTAELYVRRKPYQLPLIAYQNSIATYAWDLRNGLPDSVRINDISERFYFRQMIPPKASLSYGNDSLRISFDKTSLFDTLYLEANRQGDAVALNDLTIPLLGTVSVGIKPVYSNWNQSKTLAYAVRGKRLQCLGGTWTKGQLTFKTRELGIFALATDTIAPVVRLVTKSPNQVSLRISDDLSGLASFNAHIDGKWLLMNYDYKRALVWSEKLDNDIPLHGTFTLEVKDLSGNTQLFTTNISETDVIRAAPTPKKTVKKKHHRRK